MPSNTVSQVAGVGADQLEDLAGGGLQLQRLGQLVVALLDLAQQARVVDGDRRLTGEGLQQRHLSSLNPPARSPAKPTTPTVTPLRTIGTTSELLRPAPRASEFG